MAGAAATASLACAALLLAPLMLAIFVPLLALLAVATLTGIGPLAHYVCSRSDKKLLATVVEPAPGAPVRLVPVGSGGHRLAVRWSPGAAPGGAAARPHPVCIPNGLGATLITISKLHEALEAMGFAVLSFDRAGVGLSDARSPPPGAARSHAGAAEVVSEMKEVMELCAPGARWLLVGPSMGNIVAQCYIAAHPSDVAGLLNVDGFPFPFAAKRRMFELSGRVYAFSSALSRTGALRPMLRAAAGQLAGLGSAAFSPEVVRAEMNRARFFGSLAAEMLTMMDLADAARAAWGPSFDLVTAPPAALAALANAAPARCGDAAPPAGGGGGAWEWSEQPRSVAEPGGAAAEWTPEREARAAALDPMLAAAAAAAKAAPGAPPPPLPAAWRRLAVRALSARGYARMGPVGEAFYGKQMQTWAAAEHTMLCMLAARGARAVFPNRHHGEMVIGIEPFVASEVAALEEDVAAVGARAATP
ncbi:MAG: Alpha/Beta hydrolase protein [Monoraphidium minutum]|nr:MAG: Alpha/Beta hydrolase protein [Monoraphidium minutum]